MEDKRHLVHVKVQSGIENILEVRETDISGGRGMRVVREAWNRGPLVGNNGRYKRIARDSVGGHREIKWTIISGLSPNGESGR